VTHSGNVWERLLQARDRPHSLLRSSPLFCIGILAISKRGEAMSRREFGTLLPAHL
jgi:hypothetical protein